MTSIAANAARVPNLMVSNAALFNLNRPSIGLANVQMQLATGLRVSRPSDDAVAAGTIQLLNARLGRAEQRLRNLDHADTSLTSLDSALGEASDLILEAREIASTQVSIGTNAEERAGQAVVVKTMIERLFRLANSESAVGYMFGGSTPGRQPVEAFGGGYRYMGTGRGLVTDLDIGFDVPLTLGGNNAIGSTSARVRGGVELAPELTGETRLRDVMGATGLGVVTGPVRLVVDGADPITLDLSDAETVGDVAQRLERAIRDHEQATGTTVLGPGGVGVSATGLTIDALAGAEIEFEDLGTGRTALDLGLRNGTGLTFTAGSTDGVGLQPKLTALSPVGLVDGQALGSIRVSNLGRTVDIDLSGAETFQDIVNAVESANLGLRVELDAEGRRLNIHSEVAIGAGNGLRIEEVPGNNGTASRLGIRTFDATTPIGELNGGRGVSVVSDRSDPELNVDFVITLGNGATVRVDLRPEDVTTVGATMAKIRAAADDQLPAQGVDPADFTVGLTDGANGIAFEQSGALAADGAISVARANNSNAAVDLGLIDGVYDPATGRLLGQDRGEVRVENLFAALMDLHDALLRDDTVGISLAGEKLGGFVDAVSESRALVGGYARRVEAATRFEEDRVVLDEMTRSNLQDLDWAEATSRFSLLQVQLQAGLQSAASMNQVSLLDFLG
ncbi:MAG: hypothetical protein EA378_00880 [Phycisphaerales bacterium]|nr:MAG: hypothetical protein EA378_00880 [Phycisphaerales bacterium]